MRCTLGALSQQAADGNAAVIPADDAGVAESTVTHVLRTGRGSCAGLAGAVLLLAGPKAGLDAWVAANHVMIRTKGGRLVELLEGGRELSATEGEARLRSGKVVAPEEFPSYYAANLAVRVSALGRFDTAEKLFRQALERTPGARPIHFNFGTFLLDRGRPQEALSHFEVAAAGRKGMPEADLNRGVALSRLGRTHEAEKAFQRCLSRDPRNVLAQENLRRLKAGG